MLVSPLLHFLFKTDGVEVGFSIVHFQLLGLLEEHAAPDRVLFERELLELVREGKVDGWDDPRMPTVSGLRRRGYTPEAIRDFCERIGVAKKDSTVDLALLEHCLREDLNRRALRRTAVLRPLKVVSTMPRA